MRAPTKHALKTWPAPFESVRLGQKTHEFRRNDRSFMVGDLLTLKEWDPETETYTGRELDCRVTFVSNGGSFGIPLGYCVLSICAAENVVTVNESDWLAIQEIAAAAERLVDAVTSRMSAGTEPDDVIVWRLFKAHQECAKKLNQSPLP